MVMSWAGFALVLHGSEYRMVWVHNFNHGQFLNAGTAVRTSASCRVLSQYRLRLFLGALFDRLAGVRYLQWQVSLRAPAVGRSTFTGALRAAMCPSTNLTRRLSCCCPRVQSPRHGFQGVRVPQSEPNKFSMFSREVARAIPTSQGH